MVRSIGNDIIEISRIRASVKRHGHHFLDRIFTPLEQEYCLRHKDPAPYLAARFAAKEATAKALGTGFSQGLSWQDIEIRNNVDGKPDIYLSEHMSDILKNPVLILSMSHCREYALATVILL